MSFLLRVPGELLAEMRAYAKLREKNSEQRHLGRTDGVDSEPTEG